MSHFEKIAFKICVSSWDIKGDLAEEISKSTAHDWDPDVLDKFARRFASYWLLDMSDVNPSVVVDSIQLARRTRCNLLNTAETLDEKIQIVLSGSWACTTSLSIEGFNEDPIAFMRGVAIHWAYKQVKHYYAGHLDVNYCASYALGVRRFKLTEYNILAAEITDNEFKQLR